MFYWEGKNVDPYKLLEVPYDVTEEVLKQKFRALAKKYHTDNGDVSLRQQNAIRLICQAKEEVEKDIKLRKKEAQEKALKEEDYSSLDLEEMKKTIVKIFDTYITEYQVAKVTCEINKVKSLKKIEEFFDQGIAVANNCIALVNMAASREEVLRIKGIFDKKRKNFDENFFADLEGLLKKLLIFIYESQEVQAVLNLIMAGKKIATAQEWFTENSDALITVVRFDEELVEKMDGVLDEFKEDELYPHMSDEIDRVSYGIVVRVNEGLALSHTSYKVFEDADFIGAFRTEIQTVVDEYHTLIERRKNKIKYLKFSRNISDDMVKVLEDSIYDGDVFESLVNTLEMEIFNSHVAASKQVKKELKYQSE